MEEIGCLFCGTSDQPVVARENGYLGRRCKDCGLVYVSPRPRPDQIQNLYAHDEAQTPAWTHFEGGYGNRLHARYTLGLIQRHLERPAVGRPALLEIGPGAGYFVDESRRAGFDPYAIEMCLPLATFIQERLGIPCSSEPLSPASFGDRRFDVVYHCDVLSHFHNPIAALECMRAKLNEKGILAFETGNLGEVGQAHLDRISNFQYPDHLFFFGEASLAKLLDRTGFELLELKGCALAPQARLVGAVEALKGLLRRPSQVAPAPGQPPPSLPAALDGGQESGSGTLKRAYHGLSFALRYRVGRLAVRPGRPQTLIAVARRQ